MLCYEELIEGSVPVEDVEVGENALAAVFYTGGTTGRSKGVMLSHRNLMTNARNIFPEIVRDENIVCLHIAPIFHVACASSMFVQLLAGSTHIFVGAFAPEAFGKAVQQNKVTDAVLIPTMVQMLVDHQSFGSFDHSSLKRIAYGGSPVAAG
jgi:long-chain acyl-CoA synthetase